MFKDNFQLTTMNCIDIYMFSALNIRNSYYRVIQYPIIINKSHKRLCKYHTYILYFSWNIEGTRFCFNGFFPVGGKMAPVTKLHSKRKGAILIIAMIFVLIFAALAVSMAAMSGTNVQIASNQHKADYALGSATSGLEVERYWLKSVMMPNTTPESKYLATIYNIMQSNMDANGISNITLKHTASTLSILPVTLDSAIGQTFNGQMNIDDGNPNILQVPWQGGSQSNLTIDPATDKWSEWSPTKEPASRGY